MIIKRVNLCEEEQLLPFPLREKKTTPRVIIKMKKTAKVQLCQQVTEENAQSEINSFNDSEYFTHQHRCEERGNQHE
jgi:hypothetical protein